MKKLIFSVLPLLALITIQCSELDDSIKLEENGLTKDINALLPQTVIDEFFNLGFTINSGTNPPELANTYLASPFLLASSNITTDVIGRQYADNTIRFYEFNLEKLTVTIDLTEGSNPMETYSGFLVGDGSLFTVFFEVIKSNGVRLAKAISGSVNADGIYNLTYVLYMIDNNNVLGVIQNGSCRIFQDGDYISEIVETGGKKGIIIPANKPIHEVGNSIDR